MNWAQFKDPVSAMCLAGTVVISWALTEKVVGSSSFTVMTKYYSANSVTKIICHYSEFSETFKNSNIQYPTTSIISWKCCLAFWHSPVQIQGK